MDSGVKAWNSLSWGNSLSYFSSPKKNLKCPSKSLHIKACSAVFGSAAEILHVPLLGLSGKNLKTAWFRYGHKHIPLWSIHMSPNPSYRTITQIIIFSSFSWTWKLFLSWFKPVLAGRVHSPNGYYYHSHLHHQFAFQLLPSGVRTRDPQRMYLGSFATGIRLYNRTCWIDCLAHLFYPKTKGLGFRVRLNPINI